MSKVASGNTELAYTRKERGITIVSCMLGTFFDAVAFLLINFLVFPMSRYFHASIAEIVLSITINVIGITIGGIIFGWTADRIGRRWTLMITAGTFAVFLVLTGFITSLWELYALRFLSGVGIGGELGTSYAFLVEVWPQKTRGLGGAAIVSLFQWGNLAAVIISGAALSAYGLDFGWRAAWFIAGGVSFALFAFRPFLPESKLWKKYNDARREGKLPPNYRARSPLIEIFSRDVIKFTILGTGIWAGYLFFISGFQPFIPTLFESTYKISTSTFTQLSIIAFVPSAFIVLLNGFLADRVGRRIASLVFAAAVILSSITFIFVVRGPLPSDVAIVASPLFYSYFFVTQADGANGSLPSWLPELYPTRMRGTGTNFTLQVGRLIGSGLAPILVPLLAVSQGLGVSMGLIMLMGGIILVLSEIRLKESKGLELSSF